MRRQSLESKRAEVQFRKDDPQRFRSGATAGPLTDGRDDLWTVMLDRMERTRRMADALHRAGVSLTPYLEIGAERCQRSLVLTNEFAGDGIAADISLQSLQVAPRVAARAGYSRLPTRVCCDVNLLPIASGTLSFAFCYQTLHHLSDPTPAVAEICRALRDDGAFVFDEEPGRGWARIPLFERDDRPRSLLQRSLQRAHLLEFLSRPGGPEVRHGVTEGEFTLTEWSRILRGFNVEHVLVQTRFDPAATLPQVLAWRGPKKWWLLAKGASIHGLCRKPIASTSREAAGSIAEASKPTLVCPQCLADTKGEHLLLDESGGLVCNACKRRYPTADGVHMLFADVTGRALYPEYFD